MWQIMHRAHLQYLYEYITKFKSGFFAEIIRQILYIFLKYTQLTWGVAEKMPFYTVSMKKRVLNYREFDLEGDLVGVPHTWYLSAQSFIRLLKLAWREYDIVAMNEWKRKCVGLQRTWVSKRTVCKPLAPSQERLALKNLRVPNRAFLL